MIILEHGLSEFITGLTFKRLWWITSAAYLYTTITMIYDENLILVNIFRVYTTHAATEKRVYDYRRRSTSHEATAISVKHRFYHWNAC